VLTLVLQILSQRHKDLKNGLSAPPKLTVANIMNLMTVGADAQPVRPHAQLERHRMDQAPLGQIFQDLAVIAHG